MVEITRQPIDVTALLSGAENPAAGGVCTFIGTVRNHADGRTVMRMEYEGYAEMAVREMERIEKQVRERWPVEEMAIVHRLGMLEIGEASVVIVVACAHRSDAFEACRYAIDTLKKTVPIWKKEFDQDGAAWVEGVIPEPNRE